MTELGSEDPSVKECRCEGELQSQECVAGSDFKLVKGSTNVSKA